MLNTIFSAVLDLQLTACYVILLVLLLRFFLRKQPKIYSYALWSVVLFRLLCPFRFETVLSLIPRVQAAPQIIQDSIIPPQTPVLTAPSAVPNVFDLPTIPVEAVQNAAPFDWGNLLPYLWLAGIAALLFYSVLGLAKLKRNLRSAQEVESGVYEAQGLETAFVLGLLKPKIYLPCGLSAEEREYILLHERTHLRRGDHLIKLAAFATLCVHWFNPLVWLAFLLSTQDMEMSCDEAVIAKLGSGVKKAYSGSLLSLAAGKRILRATPLAFGEGDTKIRIKNVLNYKKPSFWVTVALAILVAVVGIGLASDPVSKDSDVSAEEAAERVQLYYPSPYIIESGAEKNVVGDEQSDRLYTIYLDVNKAVSATETHVERRQMLHIAVDGATGDIWKEQEGQWVLEHDYIAIDYETLWENRTDYIGDNSKVSHIAGNLPYPDFITYEGISIQSSKEPYELTIRLSAASEEALDSIDLKLTNTWDKILYSLIGNLGGRRYEISGPRGTKSWGMGYYDNSEDFAAAETLEGFITAVEDERQRSWRANAESMLYLANQTENMKRAAIYYMDWPEGVSAKSLKYGTDWLTYGLYCELKLSGMPAPQTGSAEEQQLRSSAAAMLEGFSCSTVSYHFDSGESLVYSTHDKVGIKLSEAEIAAQAEQAAFLRSIAEGNIPQEESTAEISYITFPAYDQRNDWNAAVMDIEPFSVAIRLPEGWSIGSEAQKNGKYSVSGAWNPLAILDANGTSVGAVAYNIFDDGAEKEGNPMAIYNQIALANHYAFSCSEPTYRPYKQQDHGVTAITEVYLSPMISEQLGYGAQEVINKGILSYHDQLNVYVAVELDFEISESIVEDMAASLSISEIIDGEQQTKPIFLFPLREEEMQGISAQYEQGKHDGVDFIAAEGSDILAVADGTVITAEYDAEQGKGFYVRVEHGGYESLCAHCSELLVSTGQQVKAGDVIAKVGSSGLSTGPHLHFVLSEDNETVDPMFYLGQTNKPFLFPLPKDSGYTLIRPFDEANNYNSEKSGVDFAVAEGTDILAVRDGTVKWIETWRSKGKQIGIYHGQGWYATYNHCDNVLVEEGQEVKAGEIIAKVAATDDESQTIFNFELGQSWNKTVVDPMEYLE